MPSSPRGWLAWSCYVRESQGRPFSACLERGGRSDPRTRDSRESAISVLILAEKEQAILRKVSRRFADELRRAGFLPDPKDGDGDDLGV